MYAGKSIRIINTQSWAPNNRFERTSHYVVESGLIRICEWRSKCEWCSFGGCWKYLTLQVPFIMTASIPSYSLLHWRCMPIAFVWEAWISLLCHRLILQIQKHSGHFYPSRLHQMLSSNSWDVRFGVCAPLNSASSTCAHYWLQHWCIYHSVQCAKLTWPCICEDLQRIEMTDRKFAWLRCVKSRKES